MEKFHQCPICCKICKSERGLLAHQLTHKRAGVTDDGASTSAGTPTKLLTCDVCYKQFKAAKNLEKHKQTHLASQAGGSQTTTSTVSSASEFNEEEFWTDDLIAQFQAEFREHLPDLFVAEAEAEDRLRQESEGSGPSGPAAGEKRSAPALIKCSICKTKKEKTFDTVEKYLTHRTKHAMNDAYSRAPSVERVKVECLLLGEKVLTKLEKTSISSDLAQDMTKIIKNIKDDLLNDNVKNFFMTLSELFMSCFSGKKNFFLLSKFTATYNSNAICHCANTAQREGLLSMLAQYVDKDSPVANILLPAVMQMFSQALLAFILKNMSGRSESDDSLIHSEYAARKENTNTVEFKQLMHFLAGANVRKILNVALRLRNPNEKSLNFLHVLREKFLITDLANAPDAELMLWTECQDRGGLLKVNSKVLEFFIQVGRLGLSLERIDGSILTDEVIEKVCGTKTLTDLWDSIISDSLDSEEAFELMHLLLCNFCVTLRNGVIGRKADELAAAQPQQKHGVSGLSFRATLV